jgi:hypothetical protein
MITQKMESGTLLKVASSGRPEQGSDDRYTWEPGYYFAEYRVLNRVRDSVIHTIDHR